MSASGPLAPGLVLLVVGIPEPQPDLPDEPAKSNPTALLNDITTAVAFFLSLYLEVVRGLSRGVAGTILIVQPLLQAVFSPGTLGFLGMGLTVVGMTVLAMVDAIRPVGRVLGALVLLGLDFALFPSLHGAMTQVLAAEV